MGKVAMAERTARIVGFDQHTLLQDYNESVVVRVPRNNTGFVTLAKIVGRRETESICFKQTTKWPIFVEFCSGKNLPKTELMEVGIKIDKAKVSLSNDNGREVSLTLSQFSRVKSAISYQFPLPQKSL